MDSSNAFIFDIIKSVVPSIVVLITTSLLVNRFLSSQARQLQMATFRDIQDATIKYKLQAYERLALFLERIGPGSLLLRVYDSSYTVADFRSALTMSINAEFEHNLSQQIYISPLAWEAVKNAKEQEMNRINMLYQKLQPDAPARELYDMIINYAIHVNQQMPTEAALNVINAEAKQVITAGTY